MLIGRNARPRAFIKPNFKGCIVVQGPTYKESVVKLKEICSDYQLIFSTWEGEDVTNYEDGDIVLYNKKPIDAGTANYHYQCESTIKGVEKAKELGWYRVFKLRSDCWIKNPDKLFQLFDKNSLNMYYWTKHNGGYFMDFFMEGECDDLIKIWSGDSISFPEKSMTTQLYKNELQYKVKFWGNRLSEEINIFTEKRKYWFNTTEGETQLPVWYNGHKSYKE